MLLSGISCLQEVDKHELVITPPPPFGVFSVGKVDIIESGSGSDEEEEEEEEREERYPFLGGVKCLQLQRAPFIIKTSPGWVVNTTPLCAPPDSDLGLYADAQVSDLDVGEVMVGFNTGHIGLIFPK